MRINENVNLYIVTSHIFFIIDYTYIMFNYHFTNS